MSFHSGGSGGRIDLTGYEATGSGSRRPTWDNDFAPDATNAYTEAYTNDAKVEQRVCCFRTRRRMWFFICCIILLVLIAIAIPIVIFVIVPNIAQSAIDASNMIVTSANITAPTEDGFVLKMAGQVTDTGSFDAEIEFEDKVKLYFGDTEIGQMEMGPLTAKAGEGAILDVSPTFEITNKEAFTKAAKIIIAEDEFSWTLKGDVRVRAMGISFTGIQLTKQLTFKGMRGLVKPQLQSFDLPDNHPLGGIAMNVNTSVENPSLFGIELGDLSFDVMYGDIRVANVNATNVTLVPGENRLPMQGRMLPQSDEKILERISDMLTDYVAGRDNDLQVVGVLARPNADAEPISWVQEAFYGTILNVTLPGEEQEDLIQSLDLGDLTMEFSEKTPWAPLTSAPHVVATFKMPFTFPMDMKQISQEVEIYDGSNMIATMSMPKTAANGTAASGRLTTSIKDIPMVVGTEQQAKFSSFLRDLAMSKGKDMTMKSVAAAVVGTAIGDVTIRDIKFNQTIPITGMNGLADVPTEFGELHVLGGTAEALDIGVTVGIQNPSTVTLIVGDIMFHVYSGGQEVGQATLSNLRLAKGKNTAQGKFSYSPKTEAAVAAGRQLLNRFLGGEDHKVDIVGARDSTKIASLKEAFASMRLTTTMPSLKEKMLRGAQYTFDYLDIMQYGYTRARLRIYNPMDIAITVLSFDAKMAIEGRIDLGGMAQEFEDGVMVLQPASDSYSPIMRMPVPITQEVIEYLITTPDGSFNVDASATIKAKVGDFIMEFDYSQQNVRIEMVTEFE